MSEKPIGNPFANLDKLIADAEKDPVGVEGHEEEVVIPAQLEKRRRRAPAPLPESSPKNEKPVKFSPEVLGSRHSYLKDELEDHLVDDGKLKKIEDLVSRAVAENPPETTVKTVEDVLYEEQLEIQDKITEAKIEEEKAYERGLSEKKLGEKVSKIRKIIKTLEDSPEAHEIVRGLPKKRERVPKITSKQFQEGVKRKNIPDYEGGENSVKPDELEKIDVTIEKGSRKRKPGLIIDAVENNGAEVEGSVKYEVTVVPEIKNNSPKKLKSSVDLAMEKTQEVANEYNETKLTKESIDKAQTIDELFGAIEKSEGIQGSSEYFDKDKLKMIIEMVRDGELGYEYITRSGGLRQKVFDILNTKKEEEKPIEPAYIVEDVEQITELPEENLTGNILNFNEKRHRTGIEKTGVSEILSEVKDEGMNIDKKVKLAEKDLANKRKSFVSAWRNFIQVDQEFQNKRKNPFNKFFMKAFNVGVGKRDQAEQYSVDFEKMYLKSIDGIIELLTEKKIQEVFSLRSNNSERKKYEKVKNIDLVKFMNTWLNKPVPEQFKSLSKAQRDELVDLSQIVRDGILTKREAEQLRDEITKLEIQQEISNNFNRDEREILDRMIEAK